jgi:hypothetical protein
MKSANSDRAGLPPAVIGRQNLVVFRQSPARHFLHLASVKSTEAPNGLSHHAHGELVERRWIPRQGHAHLTLLPKVGYKLASDAGIAAAKTKVIGTLTADACRLHAGPNGLFRPSYLALL